MRDDILQLWDSVKLLVEATDLDLRKNIDGNASAGGRARKKMRELKREVATIVKLSLELDKSRKAEKKG
ncbi:MAG: hypothetical protein ACW98X_23795 [Promethearchaeota archaeon]|jgi:hypothetical protein